MQGCALSDSNPKAKPDYYSKINCLEGDQRLPPNAIT